MGSKQMGHSILYSSLKIMATHLEFSSSDDLIIASRAGIDEDFLNKINKTVSDLRNLKRAHPGMGKVVAHLTSPTGEDFQITVS